MSESCGFYNRSGHPCRSTLPVYEAREGTPYCLLHFPGIEKKASFDRLITSKVEAGDFDFDGAWFPELCDFKNFHFRSAVNFCDATFAAGADFSGATFDGEANFRLSTFRVQADFARAVFHERTTFGTTTFGLVNEQTVMERTAVSFRDTVFGARSNVDFSGATFTEEAAFWGTRFDSPASFLLARFHYAGVFSGTTFAGAADFRQTQFIGARAEFNGVTFNAATFRGARFSGDTLFVGAVFNTEADFSGATFGGSTSFASARVADYLRFAGKAFPVDSTLDFQFLAVATPGRMTFHSAALRPRWFVNSDARSCEFTAVEWVVGTIDEDVASLRQLEIESPHNLLARAYREIAVNSEENHLYEEASRFRYLSMDALRRAHARGMAAWQLEWWYWAASGYGERVVRAAMVLAGICALFAFLYTRVGFVTAEPGTPRSAAAADSQGPEPAALLPIDAAVYSITALTLQDGDVKPATGNGRLLVALERIVGPVQIALLALAVRRKFMR